ncbi:vWA domain-containing protein [Planifilum fulgidum]|uniref:vWA domain-containing protein n=1 Tax=Planifilum fulgidum TaxID=201973 RepID=UPI0015A6D4DC|nr:VWA domain-containing protein [Planifilum fulgidum]
MNLRKISWLLLSFLFLIACSQQEESGGTNASSKPQVKQAANNVEDMLREGPGKYAGDKYDEEKVKAELDKLPNNLTADEAYSHLVALLAEDYKPELEILNKFDTTIRTNIKKPGGVNTPEGELPKQVNVEILLDASGSMAGRVSGGVKMDLAKGAIRNFVSKLPEGAQVALRVYGHKGSNQQKDKELSCKSTEVVYPLGAYDESSFQKSLDKFRPTGWTPLAAAIEQAKSDLSGKTGEKVENIIYVVSDGIETCGGDPVKAAKELHQSEIQAIVNIIGFDVDNEGQRALKKVAEAGGGKYTTVNTGEDLRKHLEEEYERLADEWEMWGTESYLEASKLWSEKWETLDKAEVTMIDKYARERDRMLKAKDYLAEKGKLEEESTKYTLDEKIWDRWRLFNKYRLDNFGRLKDQLEQAEREEKQRVEEKAKEMEEKYRQ